jgi:hypothetical protein
MKSPTQVLAIACVVRVCECAENDVPDVDAISGGKLDVPHFTGKAKIDRIVKKAGFAHHTFN